MNFSKYDALQAVGNARLHGPMDPQASALMRDSLRTRLPEEHMELLIRYNGIEAYDGYFRLLGVLTADFIDIINWNQNDCWKFAWDGRCDEYWCFGETGWGDQYAYRIGSQSFKDGWNVYVLSAFSMTPQVIASSFPEFWENEFLRNAKDPYDVTIKRARREIGQLDPSEHVVYAPPILITGSEPESRIEKMDARSAMICNGDIAMQLDAAPSGARVRAVENYQDSSYRMRLRLVWG
jgi:hypothetical protein